MTDEAKIERATDSAVFRLLLPTRAACRVGAN
jgi:hypothetical protein